MSRTFKLSVLASAILAAAPLANAYEAGDFIGRAGVATVDPDSSSNSLRTDLPGLEVIPGAKVKVESDTQLGLTFTYMLGDHFGLGLLASTPFNHDIKGDGILGGTGKLGETKHLPPTLTFQFFPMPSSSKFQPYVGAGVNYTNFFEEKTTQTLTDTVDAVAQATLGTPAGTVDRTDLTLDDSFGLAAEVGLDYMLTDNIGLNAAVWWVDIDTDADIGVYAADGSKITTGKLDVEIDPWVYMVGVSYKF
ncbi:OmpW/AlkL family protein [Marinobacter sp. F4218]|uniref:OmpW/AlkL family protein n=1 Tax=Marinobacter sp. F4218 TaxID=2862868 RepID=UPI001C638105|nr:OmpW family outer membrane protein [Marinobacter sp. F4218]MBW7471632.1 outer membrane beta-barrel protein [Marinobacter sp. F4218]